MIRLITSVLFLFIFCKQEALSQNKRWNDLGKAEKIWILLHPFSVHKAKKLTVLSVHQTDSIQKEIQFPNSKSGGRLDALRHTYWMALISNNIGPKRASWLGKAHEKKGVDDFNNKSQEEGNIPDKANYEMDTYNNALGVKIGQSCFKCTNEKLLETAYEALIKGECKIIKQNQNGLFLDVDGKEINPSEWQGKWENKRTLVRSTYNL